MQKQKEEQESISLSAASQLSEADISKEKDAVAAAGEIKVKRWIEDVTGKQLDGKLAEELRSGEVLCELANAIRPQSIDKISRSPKPFDQRENITKFIAAARAFGVLDRENFDTNDLYDGSGIRQVLICLNALGRVSATVQGFNGPPLSVSAADRTGSVNQSGKVRSLGDTLKDKISLAPQKLEPGSVEFMQQQQREKAHRERKALEKAKQEFSVGVHPTKARAQRQPKKVGRRRSSGRKLNPAVVAVAEEARRELRAKAEFEAKESAAAIVRQQALAEKEFNADVKRLQQFHPPFNAKPAATMDMLDQVKFKQDQMKAKAAWEAAHESAGTEEVPDIIAAGLVKLRDAHAEHEAKAAAEAEANARVMEKKRQAQVAAKAEKDRLAKEDRQKTAAENKAKREAAQMRAAADSEAQEQSRSELQAKMKSNARTSTTQLDEAAAESKALTKAEVKAQTKELMRLVKTAKESEQVNEISVALKQYEEALSNAQAISARDRPSKKKLVSTVKLLVAKTCDLQALMQNHAEETSTPPMQASRSEVEANDTDENSDGEEAEPEPEPEPEPAGGNSKLVMNAAALLDSDDDEAEPEPEPEPAGGNSKVVMNAAALLDSDDDEAEPEPEPEPAGGNSKLVMNAAALLDSDDDEAEPEPEPELKDNLDGVDVFQAGARYKVLSKLAVRSSSEVISEKLGELPTGTIVKLKDVKTLDDGTVRVAVQRGWCNVKSKKGNDALERVNDTVKLSKLKGMIKSVDEVQAEKLVSREKMFTCKLKGKNVQVQAGGMSLQVLDKSGKPHSQHLYQTLESWNVTKKGLRLKTKSGATVLFTSSAQIANDIADAINLQTQALAAIKEKAEAAAKHEAQAGTSASNEELEVEETESQYGSFPVPLPSLNKRLEGVFDPFAFLDDDDLVEPGHDLITLVKPQSGFGMNLSADCVVTSFSDDGSCAQGAGVTRGSRIIQVNAREVLSRGDVVSILKKLQPGDEAKFLMQPAMPPCHGTLVVKIVSANNLLSADKSGKSDPYVCVRLDEVVAKTKVEKNTINPVFNEKLELPIDTYDAPESWNLGLEVWDWDLASKDDFLGECSLQLCDLFYDAGGWRTAVINGVYALSDPNDRLAATGAGSERAQLQQRMANGDDTPYGSINAQISFTPDPTVDPESPIVRARMTCSGLVQVQFKGKGKFQKVWLCLAPGRPSLTFTRDTQGGKVLRTANADNCMVQLPKQARKNHEHALRLDLAENDSSGDTKFIIAVDTEDELERWMSSLKSYSLFVDHADPTTAGSHDVQVQVAQPDEHGKFHATLQNKDVAVLPVRQGLQVFDAAIDKLMLEHIYPYASLASSIALDDGFEIQLLNGHTVKFGLSGSGKLVCEMIAAKLAPVSDKSRTSATSAASKEESKMQRLVRAQVEAELKDIRSTKKHVEKKQGVSVLDGTTIKDHDSKDSVEQPLGESDVQQAEVDSVLDAIAAVPHNSKDSVEQPLGESDVQQAEVDSVLDAIAAVPHDSKDSVEQPLGESDVQQAGVDSVLDAIAAVPHDSKDSVEQPLGEHDVDRSLPSILEGTQDELLSEQAAAATIETEQLASTEHRREEAAKLQAERQAAAEQHRELDTKKKADEQRQAREAAAAKLAEDAARDEEARVELAAQRETQTKAAAQKREAEMEAHRLQREEAVRRNASDQTAETQLAVDQIMGAFVEPAIDEADAATMKIL
eukprot:COSAG02_NODE_4397_length_5408_cov_7.517047_2_plen_1702_part_01